MNKNIHFSNGNLVSKTNNEIYFLTFSLPSKTTCPFATESCKRRCFAKKNETFKSVRASRERNLDETKKDSFVMDTVEVLEHNLGLKKNKEKVMYVRIHTSGDFYNKEYLEKWIAISSYFKNDKRILFQAYTKSIPYLIELIEENNKSLNDINIHFCYSIWEDTSKEHIQLAEKIKLQTFTALSKEIFIEESLRGENVICNADCVNCKECYKGDGNNVIIKIH